MNGDGVRAGSCGGEQKRRVTRRSPPRALRTRARPQSEHDQRRSDAAACRQPRGDDGPDFTRHLIAFDHHCSGPRLRAFPAMPKSYRIATVNRRGRIGRARKMPVPPLLMQTRIAFLESLALERVQQVGVDRDSLAFGNMYAAPKLK